ncbi:amidohydrolase family protein [Hoeflea prorocentri]|uniref:Amidohydrolase family protein n=1 Tax=Hoeflea prorocentri TaxID=1922333 RepID=A0A9X3ZGF5_9HYPH|nr:amidohydrolase family protein [Hoeflea prorocentri]MCY6379695.1 amidohydrolase family protein [Hoeflea prorocentri]MDA5397495.1 amidohydrolase family protein [Hoeflea prorocentri]
MNKATARQPVAGLSAPKGRLPMDPPSAPSSILPSGACDSHLHIFGEAECFPLATNIYERPAEGTLDDWLGRLERQMQVLGLERAVLVGSVAYREDNRLLVEALRRGGGAFRGIALVGPDVSKTELRKLKAEGVCGVRVNMRHPGALDHEGLKRIAPLLGELGLHVQILLDCQDQFDALQDDFRAFGIKVVVDHMASFSPQAPAPYSNGFLRAMEEGWLYVKLSAPYRREDMPYIESQNALMALLSARDDRIVWGTDWPYVIYNGPQPDAGRLVDWVLSVCSERQIQRIFAQTPAELYFSRH